MPADDDLVSAAPCPKCQSPLTVAFADLGHTVECPGCGNHFRARRADAGRTAAPAAEERPQLERYTPPRPEQDGDEDDRPRRRRPRADDEPEDRPRRTPRDRFYDDRDGDGYESDLPLRDRRRFEDEDDRYEGRRKKAPGSLIALAVMHFIYAGLTLLCGVVSTVGLVVNANGAFGGPPQNLAFGAVLVLLYLVTGVLALAGGILALRRRGWGVSALALGAAALTFLADIANVVAVFNQAQQQGPLADEEEVGLVCGVAFVIVFWLGYLVTNGILLSKSRRHFR